MPLYMSCVLRYFPVIISTNTYFTIFMFAMISCEFFPSTVSGNARAHKPNESSLGGTYTNPHGGSMCACMDHV